MMQSPTKIKYGTGLVLIVAIAIITTLTHSADTQAQTKTNTIIDSAVFTNLTINGYTSVIASYSIRINEFCNALYSNQYCPRAIDLTNIRTGAVFAYYSENCSGTTNDCKAKVTALKRLPTIGDGIIAINFVTEAWPPRNPYICIGYNTKIIAGNVTLPNCKSVAIPNINPTGLLQDQSFKSNFIQNFVSTTETHTQLVLTGQSTNNTFILSNIATHIFNEQLPGFDTVFPQLVPSTVSILNQNAMTTTPIVNTTLPVFSYFDTPANNSLRNPLEGLRTTLNIPTVGLFYMLILSVIAITVLIIFITLFKSSMLGILSSLLVFIPGLYITVIESTVVLISIALISILIMARMLARKGGF